MKIFIASDHAAYKEKEALIELLSDHDVENLGTDSEESVHYPDYAMSLCQKVIQNPGSRGILLCGSGIGMSMVANRFQGIRAALCKSVEDASLSREHNDANVICFAGRMSSVGDLKAMLTKWLETDFAGGRHQERVNKFNDLGEKLFKHSI